MLHDQSDYDVRCEWGAQGVAVLAPTSDAVVIVDVLSFCTSVVVAVARGAVVYPYAAHGGAAEFAVARGAILAEARRDGPGYTLSPFSLTAIAAGTRLVLPSPNGATLSAAADRATRRVLAGCLRNAGAVAAAAGHGRITIIPAGERWPDGSLRPAVEDLVGAGAIIARLPGRRSPEAEAAVAAYERARVSLTDFLRDCGSGRELIARGFAADVELAAVLDADDCAPRLVNGGFTGG